MDPVLTALTCTGNSQGYVTQNPYLIHLGTISTVQSLQYSVSFQSVPENKPDYEQSACISNTYTSENPTVLLQHDEHGQFRVLK